MNASYVKDNGNIMGGHTHQFECSSCRYTLNTDHRRESLLFCFHCGVKLGPEPKEEPTQGEWFYQKMNGRIYSVVNPAFSTGSVTIAEIVATEADGHLMAASKKLLAACKAAMRTGIPNITSGGMVSDAIAEAEKGKQ